MNSVQTAVRKMTGISTLDHSIRLVVPSTIDVDKTVDASAYVESVTGSFAKMYGGATVYQATGAWFSDALGKTVTEQVTIVESFTTEDAALENMDRLFEIALSLKAELSQEAIAVVIDGELHLV